MGMVSRRMVFLHCLQETLPVLGGGSGGLGGGRIWGEGGAGGFACVWVGQSHTTLVVSVTRDVMPLQLAFRWHSAGHLAHRRRLAPRRMPHEQTAQLPPSRMVIVWGRKGLGELPEGRCAMHLHSGAADGAVRERPLQVSFKWLRAGQPETLQE